VIVDQNLVTGRSQLATMGLQALQDQITVGDRILAEFLNIARARPLFGTGLRIGALPHGLSACRRSEQKQHEQ
jgi:hypothetical protein